MPTEIVPGPGGSTMVRLFAQVGGETLAQAPVIFIADPGDATFTAGPMLGRPFLHAVDENGNVASVFFPHPDSWGGGGGGGDATNLSISNRTTNTLQLNSSTGTDVTVPAATTSLSGLMTGADKTLLGTALQTMQRGTANGVAPLDANSLIPAIYLPGYVDDVVEVANFAALPATGETSKMYYTLDTGLIYRWGGSAYVELSPSPGSTDAVPEGSVNQYFTVARVRATALTGLDTTTIAEPAASDTVLTAIGKLTAWLRSVANSSGGGSSVPATGTGNTLVLDSTFRQYNRLTVSGPTTIDLSGLTPGAEASKSLVADGVNAPTVTNGLEWDSSAGYRNEAQILNVINAWSDGVDRFYSWGQPAILNPVPAPDTTPPARGTPSIANATPTKIVVPFTDASGSISSTLTGSVTLGGSARTVVSATVVGLTVEIVVNTAYASTDTATISYPAGWVRDAAGNQCLAGSNVAVTNNVAPVGGGTDAATTAWLARVSSGGGSVSTPTQDAVNTFFATIRAAGLIGKLRRLNLGVGNDLNTSLIPQINTLGASVDTQVNTVAYAENLGWGSTGANQYISTGAIQDTPIADIGVYMRTSLANNSTAYCMIGASTASDTYRIVANRNPGDVSGDGRVSAMIGGPSGGSTGYNPGGAPAGCYHAIRRSLSEIDLFRNGTQQSTNATTITAAAATGAYLVMAQGAAGGSPTTGTYLPSGSRVAGYWIGDGTMTDAEITTFYNAMQAFQTSMGRQV